MPLRLTNAALAWALAWGVTSACIITPGAHLGPGHHSPLLVTIAPGIWAVEDYHTAVFFAHEHYWYYDGRLWNRSIWYDRDWVVVDIKLVPAPILKLDHKRYVWYRGPTGTERIRPARQHIKAPPGHRGKHSTHHDTGPGHGKAQGKKKKKKKKGR